MTDERSSDDVAPPAAATWLVRSLCPAQRLEELEGDLNELFARRVSTRGASAARRAYWRDALGLCLHAVHLHRRGRVARRQGVGGLRVHLGRILMLFGAFFVLCAVTAVVCGLLGFAFPRAWGWAYVALVLSGDPVFALLTVILGLRRDKRTAPGEAKRSETTS
jgi:hypothetical protein